MHVEDFLWQNDFIEFVNEFNQKNMCSRHKSRGDLTDDHVSNNNWKRRKDGNRHDEKTGQLN